MQLKSDERLIHDHTEVGDLLGEVKAALEAHDVVQSHAALDLFWARLAIHIRAEHLHLFPAISDAVSRTRSDEVPRAVEVEKAITELRHDHDFFMRELSQSVVIMRGLLENDSGQVADQLEGVRTRVNEVEARLASHNEIEERGIYNWVTRLLGEAEQSDLAARVARELENMPPRFR